MGSYLMHIAVSEKVRRRLNLSHKFIYGSILPDMLKVKLKDRKGTHFLKSVTSHGFTQPLPIMDDAKKILDVNMDKEIRAGYLAHLLEDVIWFEDYVTVIRDNLTDEEKTYMLDETGFYALPFNNKMYEEYSRINGYIMDICNIDYAALKNELEKILTKEELDMLSEYDSSKDIIEIEENKHITKELLEKYILDAEEKVFKEVKELLGE